jgi:drug/metabolite transporter (DMT)-like permease
MTKKRYWIGVLFVFGAAFGFALKGIFIKSAYRYGIDSISLLSLRMLFAAPFYVVVLWYNLKNENSISEPKERIEKKSFLQIIYVGAIGYYLSAYLNFLGLNYITANLERIVLFIYPTFVLLINTFILKRKISSLQWLALGITYIGILIAFLKNLDTNNQKDIFLGVFWVIMSGLTYSFYLVSSEKLILRIGTTVFTCTAMLAALPFVLVHCFIANRLQIWHFADEIYWIALAMSIISTVIPTFMLSAGINRVGAGNTSIIASIGPIFTILLAYLFLNETIWIEQIIGTFLVLIGVFLIGWKGKK